MTKRIRLTVTREDIDNGLRGRADACPLALALQRRGYGYAIVGRTYWFTHLEAEAIPLSGRASLFVRRFDMERPVSPATFLLPVSR